MYVRRTKRHFLHRGKQNIDMALTKAQLDRLKIINQIKNLGYCKNINLY